MITAGFIVCMSRELRRVAAAIATLWCATATLAAPTAAADPQCAPGGPPLGAATKPVGDLYGQPATLWLTNDDVVGISTDEGTSSLRVLTTSPIRQQAMIFDARQDGNHQIIVDTGRQADLYTAAGCVITPVVDQLGKPFQFDLGHRLGNGDGYGCGDLGDGPALIGFLNLKDQPGMMRRTEIDLDGSVATIGRSDVVPVTTDVSCGGLTMEKDGIAAPF